VNGASDNEFKLHRLTTLQNAKDNQIHEESNFFNNDSHSSKTKVRKFFKIERIHRIYALSPRIYYRILISIKLTCMLELFYKYKILLTSSQEGLWYKKVKTYMSP